ncbi:MULTISPECIES: NtaA/DmoA family FMN-dependent monooxygenase [Nocardiaceae]|jgi:FMN-dependent oxidoreductase (nitrilotriacetate monooxygenase family)|uniref:NtaA/DmoA family FMN-dependent monooxygenase n=1 Tax=Nocardiaceae TaxID=85025 RepID=UPI000569162E|nr:MULTISPECIES: NtaA/DmoA family FMN-dependent monooxygenase [Rhodococcus]OZF06382.1 FMNH2-dependent monooxygenase [Rhodococcus sp. 15-1189-1-1a]OZF21151.1 FMNH2-dependent monooxygenase [Rhodococcus sp. 14-2686-1-2]OZF57650.1 FMNH2-dependent monooxygenase [Rhodococcus sp. 14-2470-1b]
MTKFHLGWFTNFSNPPWNTTWAGDEGKTWANGELHVDFARALERACFDYIMLEDSSMVSDAFENSSRVDLKYGLYAPKHDPVTLVPVLTAATEHIGVIATCSTSFYPPWLLARRFSTLDHVSKGRVGWNVVTSSEDRAAQNYGMDKLAEHDQRYERADEFVDLVKQLWASWEDDAMVLDRESGTYVDHTKVHVTDFRGKFHASRGPLNLPKSPQGEPVICQAGGSPRGREFAARNAETILSAAKDPVAMKAFRDDIRMRMEKAGRDPDSCKIMFITQPVLADTDADARAKVERMTADVDSRIESALGHISALTEIDLSSYELDEEFPELSTNGHRTTLGDFLSYGNTPRKAALGWSMKNVHYVGTPDSVAEQMGETMDFVGGDGFLVTGSIGRRYVGEITEGLVPALQRRGLVRTKYEHAHFRDNLLSF